MKKPLPVVVRRWMSIALVGLIVLGIAFALFQ